MKYLSIGTYPRLPADQGGRLRVDAMHRALRAGGWETRHLWVGAAVASSTVSSDDVAIPFSGAFEKWLREQGRRPDVWASRFLQDDLFAGDRFQAAITAFDPDVIAVEQAMLWPALQQYFADHGARRAVTLVYSSHNVEHRMLLEEAACAGGRVSQADLDAMFEIEMGLVNEADLVVVVSAADADHFRLHARKLVLAPNGSWQRPLDVGGKGAIFVSSAHPPNVEGFLRFLGEDLTWLPPGERITVVGGACEALKRHYPDAMRSAHLDLRGRIDDDALESALAAHRILLLPISHGGGTNIKTAQALATGKLVLATPFALRGFEPFMTEHRVRIGNTPDAFRAELVGLLASPATLVAVPGPGDPTASLRWDRCLAGLPSRLLASNRFGWRPVPTDVGPARCWLTSEEGWSRHDDGTLRAAGGEATLTLQLAGEEAAHELGLAVLVSAMADLGRPVILTIEADDERAAIVQLEWPDMPTRVRLRVRPDNGVVRLRFRCDRLWSPAQLGLGDDPRPMGLALHGVEI